MNGSCRFGIWSICWLSEYVESMSFIAVLAVRIPFPAPISKLHPFQVRQVLYFHETSMRFMLSPDDRIAGTLFLVASAQFILCLVIAEALYPDYSVADNYISDLGVGPSSLVFNSSAFLFGVLSIVGTYFLPRTVDFRALTVLLILMGIGAMGVGIFTSAFSPTIHGVVSLMAFGFGALAAIASFKVSQLPLSAISMALGMITLGALVLFAAGLVTTGSLTSNEPPTSEYFAGIGPGGMERMIVYPALIWLTIFSGRLIGFSEKQENLENVR